MAEMGPFTTTTSATVTLPVTVGGSPNPFTTRTVHTLKGHRGQVLVNGRIVWEGKPRKTAAKASSDARKHLDARLAEVFA